MSGSEYFLCKSCGTKLVYTELALLDESRSIIYCAKCFTQLQAENEVLKDALDRNLSKCDFFDGEICGEIAIWGVFDHSWTEYFCDKHKDSSQMEHIIPEKLVHQIIAQQALKGENNEHKIKSM